LELGDWFVTKDPADVFSQLSPLEDVERAHIVKVLESVNWRVSGEKGAAQILDIHPQTLFSRMKKLAIARP
jgi:transcriptional regulator with GAF, ATPase, and Fis domain